MRDHPRLRGEYARKTRKQLMILGSPPLARGIQMNSSKKGLGGGITPACAGNTLQSFPFSFVYEDHPRLRGEYVAAMLVLPVT